MGERKRAFGAFKCCFSFNFFDFHSSLCALVVFFFGAEILMVVEVVCVCTCDYMRCLLHVVLSVFVLTPIIVLHLFSPCAALIFISACIIKFS